MGAKLPVILKGVVKNGTHCVWMPLWQKNVIKRLSRQKWWRYWTWFLESECEQLLSPWKILGTRTNRSLRVFMGCWGCHIWALDVLEVHLNLILTLQCCLDWRQSNRASCNSRCCVTVLYSVVRLKGLNSSALLKNSYSVLWSLSRMYFWILDRVMHVSTLQAVLWLTVGLLLIGRLVVWSLAGPICMPKHPRARYWNPSCSWCIHCVWVCEC